MDEARWDSMDGESFVVNMSSPRPVYVINAPSSRPTPALRMHLYKESISYVNSQPRSFYNHRIFKLTMVFLLSLVIMLICNAALTWHTSLWPSVQIMAVPLKQLSRTFVHKEHAVAMTSYLQKQNSSYKSMHTGIEGEFISHRNVTGDASMDENVTVAGNYSSKQSANVSESGEIVQSVRNEVGILNTTVTKDLAKDGGLTLDSDQLISGESEPDANMALNPDVISDDDEPGFSQGVQSDGESSVTLGLNIESKLSDQESIKPSWNTGREQSIGQMSNMDKLTTRPRYDMAGERSMIADSRHNDMEPGEELNGDVISPALTGHEDSIRTNLNISPDPAFTDHEDTTGSNLNIAPDQVIDQALTDNEDSVRTILNIAPDQVIDPALTDHEDSERTNLNIAPDQVIDPALTDYGNLMRTNLNIAPDQVIDSALTDHEDSERTNLNIAPDQVIDPALTDHENSERTNLSIAPDQVIDPALTDHEDSERTNLNIAPDQVIDPALTDDEEPGRTNSNIFAEQVISPALNNREDPKEPNLIINRTLIDDAELNTDTEQEPHMNDDEVFVRPTFMNARDQDSTVLGQHQPPSRNINDATVNINGSSMGQRYHTAAAPVIAPSANINENAIKSILNTAAGQFMPSALNMDDTSMHARLNAAGGQVAGPTSNTGDEYINLPTRLKLNLDTNSSYQIGLNVDEAANQRLIKNDRPFDRTTSLDSSSSNVLEESNSGSEGSHVNTPARQNGVVSQNIHGPQTSLTHQEHAVPTSRRFMGTKAMNDYSQVDKDSGGLMGGSRANDLHLDESERHKENTSSLNDAAMPGKYYPSQVPIGPLTVENVHVPPSTLTVEESRRTDRRKYLVPGQVGYIPSINSNSHLSHSESIHILPETQPRVGDIGRYNSPANSVASDRDQIDESVGESFDEPGKLSLDENAAGINRDPTPVAMNMLRGRYDQNNNPDYIQVRPAIEQARAALDNIPRLRPIMAQPPPDKYG